MPLEPRLKYLVALATRMERSAVVDEIPVAVGRSKDARRTDLLIGLVVKPGPKSVTATHHQIPVEGGSIVLRLYRAGPGRLPLHVHIHGGGWVTGNLEMGDRRCRALARDAGCVVASVDYRLAPEHQYPGQGEDCYAALLWLVEHAGELDIDADRISVGGESAGGNLAAVVALMARDRQGPKLVLQVLDIPVTDCTTSHPSYTRYGTGYLLTAESMRGFVRDYIADPERITEAYASPLLAEDLSGLPPALVTTAQFDPLVDEGRAYADRLKEAGVPTTYLEMPGHIHASFMMTRLLASSEAYYQEVVKAMKAAYQPA
ncbi:MAG TPA: alpha/beta hydrolase [Acidimicrobiales bacterium]|jgi:acetyl esterase|nr:alpha/beta hydrolase [Acidimicrobiales bacterium]